MPVLTGKQELEDYLADLIAKQKQERKELLKLEDDQLVPDSALELLEEAHMSILSDKEFIEGDEILEDPMPDVEDFVAETQRQWRIDHPQAIKVESLDEFLNRKAEEFEVAKEEDEIESERQIEEDEEEHQIESTMKSHIKVGGKPIR